jgi:hypothetical protein
MPGAASKSAGTVLLLFVGFVLLGTPLVAYIWESTHLALAGHLTARRFAVSVPLAAALAGLLWAGARRLERLAAPPAARPHEPNLAGTLFLAAVLLMVVFGGWLTGFALLLER